MTVNGCSKKDTQRIFGNTSAHTFWSNGHFGQGIWKSKELTKKTKRKDALR